MQFYLCAILQKSCPIDTIDDMAEEQQEDRGNEEVVEIEPLQGESMRSSVKIQLKGHTGYRNQLFLTW